MATCRYSLVAGFAVCVTVAALASPPVVSVSEQSAGSSKLDRALKIFGAQPSPLRDRVFVRGSLSRLQLFNLEPSQRLQGPRAEIGNEVTLTAEDAVAGDEFGWSVAIDGDNAIVGAYRQDHAGDQSGAAYVFVRADGDWSQQARLVSTDAAPQDWFGQSVAINGNTAVVGAIFADVAGASSRGAAYVFVRNGTNWTQQAKLIAPSNVTGGLFGWSVAIEENTIVVGGPFFGTAPQDQGYAFVFVRSGTSWVQQAALHTPDPAQNDFFGTSVAISSNTLVSSANFKDGPDGENSGAVYVFVRSGTAWTQQEKLVPGEPAANAQFGYSVGLDHDTVAIGAPYSFGQAGSVYVFSRINSIWSQEARLLASDGVFDDRLGQSIGISGTQMVAGAYGTGSWNGSAYVFSNCSGAWQQIKRLDASDTAASDYFGTSAGISGDLVIVGANHKAGSAGTHQGAAYIYTVQPYPNDNIPVSLVDSPVCSGGAVSLTMEASESNVSYQLLADSLPIGSPVDGTGGEIMLTGPLTTSTPRTFSVSVLATNVQSGCSIQLQEVQTATVWPSGGGDGDASGSVDGNDIRGFITALLGFVPGAVDCAYDMNVDGVVDLADIDPFVAAALATN